MKLMTPSRNPLNLMYLQSGPSYPADLTLGHGDQIAMRTLSLYSQYINCFHVCACIRNMLSFPSPILGIPLAPCPALLRFRYISNSAQAFPRLFSRQPLAQRFLIICSRIAFNDNSSNDILSCKLFRYLFLIQSLSLCAGSGRGGRFLIPRVDLAMLLVNRSSCQLFVP
jgi:hypothetical protein